ncbi:putative tubulin polyglutamylase ttll-15 isoform X1 [Saccoglossus kowalevskii]
MCNENCKLCNKCLSSEEMDFIRQAYLEHINRHNMRRLFPVPLTQNDCKSYDISQDRNLTDTNKLMHAWFRAKCKEDIAWCF